MGKKKFKYANGRKTAINNEELINHYRTTVHNSKRYNKKDYNSNSDYNNDVYDNFKYFKSSEDFRSTNKKRHKDYESESESEDDYEEEEQEESEDNSIESLMNSDIDSAIDSSDTNHSSSSLKKEGTNFQFPWVNERTVQLPGILRLHQEILDFYNFMMPRQSEIDKVNEIFKIVKNMIKSKFPSYKVKLFGSNSTGLNLPNSDMDIVVIPNKINDKYITLNPQQELKIFNVIKGLLYSNGNFTSIRLIQAKVPIIKTKFNGKVDIDISFGRKNGYAATKIINTILNEYPAMRPLLFVLKYYMRQKGLNVTYTGGISSFCLFSLVYAYILYVKKNKEFEGEITLGHLLIGFFDFFAFRFNYSKVGISVRLGGFFYKRSERFFRDNSSSVKGDGILSLENFQNINQDIGGNCFRYDEVIDAFKNAYCKLGDFIKKDEREDNVNFSYLGRFIRKDKLIKKRKFRISSNKK